MQRNQRQRLLRRDNKLLRWPLALQGRIMSYSLCLMKVSHISSWPVRFRNPAVPLLHLGDPIHQPGWRISYDARTERETSHGRAHTRILSWRGGETWRAKSKFSVMDDKRVKQMTCALEGAIVNSRETRRYRMRRWGAWWDFDISLKSLKLKLQWKAGQVGKWE